MRQERIQLLSDVKDMLADVDYAYFISYKGLTVEQFRKLRGELRTQKAECKVLKNTLIRKAFEEKGFADNAVIANLKTDTAVVFGCGDSSAVAKIITKFGETNDKVQTKDGFMDGAIISNADIKVIAELPSKEVLQSQLLGVLNAPAQNFVSVLHQSVAGIVNVLNAQKNKLEE